MQRIMERADTVCVSAAERRILAWQFPAALGRSTIVADGVEVARLRSATPAPVEVPTWADITERQEEIYRQTRACRHLCRPLTRRPVPA